MPRLPHFFASLAAAAPLDAGRLLGRRPSEPPPDAPAQVVGTPGPGQGPEARPGGHARPARIDTSKVDSVVQGEIEGGESKNPTPDPVPVLRGDGPGQDPGRALSRSPCRSASTPVAAVIPASNPMTKGKVELGKQLYYDQRISLDATVSCASCHDPAKGWTDSMKTSVGIKGQKGGPERPDGAEHGIYGRTMFWDGRAPSLEGQAQGPIQNKIEMGDQSYKHDRRAAPGDLRLPASSSSRSSAPKSPSTAWPRRSPRSSGPPCRGTRRI